MVSKIFVLVTVLAACNAVPWNYGTVFPAELYRNARSPAISYGFGTGVASNIGGIAHSTGYGASFSTEGGNAYGIGSAETDANGYARGVGIANAGNTYPVHQYPSAPRNTYVQPATNFGHYGNANALSSASTVGRNQFNSAVAHSIGSNGYNSAVSSAQNVRGYGSAISQANTFDSLGAAARTNNYGSAVSSAHTSGSGYGTAVSAAENINGVGASTAQTLQRRYDGSVQNSGASSINAPGLRAAHSHAIDTGYY